MANRITTWSANQILTAADLNGEFNNIYTGTVDRTAGRSGNNDDIPITLGTDQDVQIEWETGQTQDALVIGLSGSMHMIVMDKADMSTNLAIGTKTDPTLFIHSADGATAADYLELYHDQTNSVINTGNGSILLRNAGTTKITVGASDITFADDLLFTDATYNIGASGATRPQDLFLSRNAVIGGTLDVTGACTFSSTITLTDDDWVGLGASAGRFYFDDQTNDEFIIQSALVGVNTDTPGAQTHIVSGATGRVGLIVSTAASGTANVVEFEFNGTDRTVLLLNSSETTLRLNGVNLGNNVPGPVVEVNRNTSAGAEGPSAGMLNLTQADGGDDYIWADNSSDPGQLRIATNSPTGSSGSPARSDTSGTVVGTQTSWHQLKANILLGTVLDDQAALTRLLTTPLYNFQLKTKIGRNLDKTPIWAADQKKLFGFVVYEKDKGSWFSTNDRSPGAIPALDERMIFGTLAGAVKALNARIVALEAKLP